MRIFRLFPACSFFSSTFSIGGTSGPVVPCHKDGGDCKEIVGKFSWGIVRILVENHEVCVGVLEEDFKQLDTEPCKSVPVHNHKLLEISRQRAFQNGLHSLALEVDPGTDVTDDSMSWVMEAQVLDLALKVFFLVRTANPGVRNLLSVTRLLASKSRFKGFNGVETFPTGTKSYGVNFSVISPFA